MGSPLFHRNRPKQEHFVVLNKEMIEREKKNVGTIETTERKRELRA